MTTAKVSFAGMLPDDRSETSLVLTIAAPWQVTLPRELLPFGLVTIVAAGESRGQATHSVAVG
ncbi:MAG TPA: hypothetical protein VN624_02445 [Rhodanobacter sp.]|nr:hypothetical protein [Rhodanobacter sp.]